MLLTSQSAPTKEEPCLVVIEKDGQKTFQVATFTGEWRANNKLLKGVTQWQYVDMLISAEHQLDIIEDKVSKYYPDENDADFEDGNLLAIGEFVALQLGYL